jgi:hypothetical protein
MKRNRTLKVVRAFSRQIKPLLPLQGSWLEHAGFQIGMQVDIIVRDQCLVITPAKDNSNRQSKGDGTD